MLSGPESYVNWLPLSGVKLESYQKSIVHPLDLNQTALRLLVDGNHRKKLQIHTTGDYSLLVTYKGKEGCVLSFDGESDDLTVLQIQGSKAKGYRVSQGLDWIRLFADQVVLIASYRESPYNRIVLPCLPNVPGLYEDTEDIVRTFETACQKYVQFIALAKLAFSPAERIYARDIKHV